jgi:hypothetical protein
VITSLANTRVGVNPDGPKARSAGIATLPIHSLLSPSSWARAVIPASSARKTPRRRCSASVKQFQM